MSRHSSSYGPRENNNHNIYDRQPAPGNASNMMVLHPSRQSTITQRPAVHAATPSSPLHPKPPPISRCSTDDSSSASRVAMPSHPASRVPHRSETYVKEDYYSFPTTSMPKAYFNDEYFPPPSTYTTAPAKASNPAPDHGILVLGGAQVLSLPGRGTVTEPLDKAIRQLEVIPETQRKRTYVTIAWNSVRVIYDELIQDLEVIDAEYSYWEPQRADRRAYDSYQRATSLGQRSYNKLVAMREEVMEDMQVHLTEKIPLQEVLDILYQVHACLRNAEAVRERVGKLMAAEEKRDERKYKEGQREHEERMYGYKERAEEQTLQRGHKSREHEIKLQQYAERKEIHEAKVRRDERLTSIVKRVVEMCRAVGVFVMKSV